MTNRAGVAIVSAALGLRLAFVAWAPGVPTGDGLFYSLHAEQLSRGFGFVNPDGSPGIRWMPGWPAVLAGTYAVTGPAPRAGMAANAVFGALTSLLVFVLGSRLFGRRIGLIAGTVYAVWPAMLYFSATTFTEPLFVLLLVGSLLAFSFASRSGRPRWLVTSGAVLGLAGWVRGEVVLLSPVLLALLAIGGGTRTQKLRSFTIAFGATALVLLPWTVRNLVVFDRFIPLSASGAVVAWLGHHPRATGGEDLRAITRYGKRFEWSTSAERSLAIHDHGWRDAGRFAVRNPGREARLAGKKLWLTYSSDDASATIVRGPLHPAPLIRPEAWSHLARTANLFWYAVLVTSAIGLASVRRWSREARWLLLGLVGTWAAMHVLFIGGPRFHAPETPAFAIFAALGLESLWRCRPFGWLRSLLSARRSRRS